jgi:hypothetical protein
MANWGKTIHTLVVVLGRPSPKPPELPLDLENVLSLRSQDLLFSG